MKKKLYVPALLFLLLLLAAACGKKNVDLDGTWTAVSCLHEGQSFDCSTDFLVLRPGGEGELSFAGTSYTLTYESDGTSLSFVDNEGDSFEGEISNGTITGTYCDYYEYVLNSTASEPSISVDTSETEESEVWESAAVQEDGFAELSECRVRLAGTEAIEDFDGKPAVIFYYDFTNLAEIPVAAEEKLTVSAVQDDSALPITWSVYGEGLEEDLSYYALRPGVTVRCAYVANYDPEGGTITLTISDPEGERLKERFEPDAFSGAPEGSPWELCEEPQWLGDVPTEIQTDSGYFVITGTEIVESHDGEAQVLRVCVDFTNTSDEERNMLMSCDCRAFQDGIELAEGWAMEELEEDEARFWYADPGETLSCTVLYTLRSESSVEFEFYDYWEKTPLAGLLVDIQSAAE